MTLNNTSSVVQSLEDVPSFVTMEFALAIQGTLYQVLQIWKGWKDALITQIILAFWLVLAYDLLEDRSTIDVIIAKFLPLCFKMAESFENVASILHDWAKDKSKQILLKQRTSTRSRD